MSDDFFTSVPLRRPQRSPSDDVDDFAHAISLRFGSADLRTARLLPDDLPNDRLSPQPPPPSSLPPPPPPLPPPSRPLSPHTFPSLSPSALSPFLHDPTTLILDIRPHAAHAAARILNAVSLSVPTTLLKRPLFSLSKLSQMLPSPSSRARFATWSSAARILVYDSDSTSSPDSGIIAGLLRKFRTEGFSGELAWVRGGFQAVWREARDLTTTDLPPPEEDDPDPTSTTGTLRTSQLPKAAFSLFSTTAAPPPQLPPIPGAYPQNTPAPSASRAANPFFDTIRQNVELSHGITERIPLRLSRRVRSRIHDLPFPWLREIATRSALRHPSTSRHPGLDSLESGSESSDDPHTSDPDENDPSVEEGAEALAMQFYRIELAEQRRLRSIMEHHTKESELAALVLPIKPRRTPDKGAPTLLATNPGVSVRNNAKSAPGTPQPVLFPFSITAGVEKGTKNRYTHIWPFEHARVRLHDGRHQGSHPGRRDKSRAPECGRSARERDRQAEQDFGWQDQGSAEDKQRRSRSSPAFGTGEDQELSETTSSSRYFFLPDARLSGADVGPGARLARPPLSPGPSVPQVKIEYDLTEQGSRFSGVSTPATALPLPTPPFYTPMEVSPVPTPMRVRPLHSISLPSGVSVSPGVRLGAQSALQASSLSVLGPLPSFPLRLPNRSGGLLPSDGEQAWTSESLSSSAVPFGGFSSGEAAMDVRTKRDVRREPSPGDDYVNASYVQPLGTRKRYIATQGPLPSTYVDFWTLVWEQNVHVIVMLTREVENAMVKCGSYWTDTEFGPLRLELISTSPQKSPSSNALSADISKQGFFAIREPQATQDQTILITRVFALSHTSYPGVPPRRITHLQYLDWSDMNVPDDPRGVLDLIRKLEQAVAESTPGPSPSGSLSPGSASGSQSGSQSPVIGPEQKSYDTLLSPTSAGPTPASGRRRHGSEWRHPELDPKTGVAAFALGRVPPVLLHCSAGVGRTGGFIAVDAILDGVRRELRRTREERSAKKAASGVIVAASTEGKDDSSGGSSLESTETGIYSMESSGKESASDGSERMDVDEPPLDEAETRGPVHIVNTVPIPVSAGDRTKGRRGPYSSQDHIGGQLRSSSEPLVVHVPLVGADNVPEEAKMAGIDFGDPKVASWQSFSTREWVEDQTHTHAEEADHPPLSSLTSGRGRSPGSFSNSSGPSAGNSVDSMNGSVNANASGSASGSGRGITADRKSGSGSASGSGSGSAGGSRSGSGSGRLPPSSVSKAGSGSISHSNSGSGTGTSSHLGSSLLRVRVLDSSVTSISAESTDSLSPGREPKSNPPLHQPSKIHTTSSSDMEIDHPPRPVSAPLQTTQSNMVTHKPTIGSSPVASFSTPILPPARAATAISFGGGTAENSVSRPNSDVGTDALASPSQDFESGESADAEESGKNSQQLSDESEEIAVPLKSRSNLWLNTDLGSLRIPGTLHHGRSAKSPILLSSESKGREKVSPVPHAQDSITSLRIPSVAGALGASEHDADHPVIDYKLPRELHSDLSPPLISSFAEPICTVIQDMREQRMSLCQSLRQYVFVHAAIIEGALRIVDEERELWGSVGTSDDASSVEGEPGAGVEKSGKLSGYGEGPKVWSGGTNKTEVAVKTPELDHGAIPRRTRPPHISTSSSSGVSSPSKGKRGPSPTELLREDKTGALSLNKRPSIQRQTTYDEGQLSFGSTKSSPVASEDDGGLREAAVGTSTSRLALGRLAVPEKGALT